MVNEDILAGIRNAIEKGESLEKAKQSFISAGYPIREVEEAANVIQSGSALVVDRGEKFQPLKIQQQTQEEAQKKEQLQQIKQTEIQKGSVKLHSSGGFRKNLKIILLLIILLLLIGVLIVTIVFREEIVAMLS